MHFTDEHALDQLANYPEWAREYYRKLRAWFKMSPLQALRYFLRGDLNSEWEDEQ